MKKHTLRRLLGFLKPYIKFLLFSTLLSFFIVILDGVSIWLLGTLPKSVFIAGSEVMSKPVFSLGNINEYLKYITWLFLQKVQIKNPLLTLCFLITIFYTLKNIIAYVRFLIVQYINLNITNHIRNHIYNHVLKLPLTYFDRNKTGNIISCIMQDVNQIKGMLSNTLSKLIIEPIRLITFVTLLCIINIKLALLIFAIYPVLGFVITKIGQSVRRRSKRWLNKVSDMMSVLNESLYGIRAVKMFNTSEMEAEKFAIKNEQIKDYSFKASKVRGLTGPFTETLAVYVTATLLWYGGREVLSGTSSFEATDFFRFLFILFSSYKPLKALGSANNTIQNALAAADRVFNLLDNKKEPLYPPKEIVEQKLKEEIKFDNISFTYPQTQTPVLKEISFSLKKNQTIALVGSSGSGKSTILDLLPRFYEVTEGAIYIDGKNINSYNLMNLRNLFGIVSQETILFNDTIKNNITYGTKVSDMEAINNAAIHSNSMEFIKKLPDGMETIIGEHGISLSGGQRQRLAIARALLQNNSVLILDEATSALDTESERYVQQAINNLIKNRTVLVVAHRLSTIIHADKIIVLEDGKIVEEGTHKTLLAQNKRYKYLYDMQFSDS